MQCSADVGEQSFYVLGFPWCYPFEGFPQGPFQTPVRPVLFDGPFDLSTQQPLTQKA
jgi:hypothetical protein